MQNNKYFNKDNYKKILNVNANKPTLVYFFKPDCMFCKLFENDWNLLYNNDDVNYIYNLIKIYLNTLNPDMVKKQLCFKTVPNLTLYSNTSIFIENYIGNRRFKTIYKYLLSNNIFKKKDYTNITIIKEFNTLTECSSILPEYYLPCVKLKF